MRRDQSEALIEDCRRSEHDVIGRIAARKDLGAARANIEKVIAFIEERRDCIDFRAHILLRSWRLGGACDALPRDIWERVKRTLLDMPYRDFPGGCGIFHRSENHRICYITAELLTAQMWPEETFGHTGIPAREHYLQARNDFIDWTNWVGTYGTGEWSSSTYYAVDILSLLDVWDFCDDSALRLRAQWVLDGLVLDLALGSYEGIFRGTQGRCYVGPVLSPCQQHAANVVPFFCGTWDTLSAHAGLDGLPPPVADHIQGGGRFLDGFLATTGYRPPEAVVSAAEASATMTHRARHRSDDRYYPPPAVENVKDLDLYHDINTVVHRTPCGMLASVQDYRPGEPGAQVQAWQATLSLSAIAFTSHPGSEELDGRPGYWIGSARLPRICQHAGSLVALYAPPEDDALPFTHAYFPRGAFDENAVGTDWAAGRVGNGYLGLRCTGHIDAVETGPWAGFELRGPDGPAAWVVELSDEDSSGSFDEFVRSLSAAELRLDAGSMRMSYASIGAGHMEMAWTGEALIQGEDPLAGPRPRHDGPVAQSVFGSGVTQVRCGEDSAQLCLESHLRGQCR